MLGISSRQGVHHVAQKLSSTTLPRYSDRRCILPCTSSSSSAGVAPPFHAFSGCAAAGHIDRVELAVNGVWRDAVVERRQFEHAWQAWRITWDARPGEHELACRATDSTGERQPLEPPW